MKEPIFLKESSNAEIQLEQLKRLKSLLNEEGQAIISQDIRYLEYGIAGEKNIAYELRNSHMPMYILHDIYLEDGDLNAQIDYLVFTKKICFVIECKNLYGNIEINNAGNFIRTMEVGGLKKKEGIYSPITQNQRHLDLMKKLRVENKGNLFTKFMTEKYFENCNKAIVVLANPKTILNAKFAKKEVKEKVIRADQLVGYIKNAYEQSKEPAYSEDKMLEWAQSYLDMHKEVYKDYTVKYESYKKVQNEEAKETNTLQREEGSIENSAVIVDLKNYRWGKIQQEIITTYLIYNNNQVKSLIEIMPVNKEELLQIAGFGETKVKKYGDDILKIIHKL